MTSTGNIEVAVSIISLNQREDIERLMPSLCGALADLKSVVLMVDNRSTDNSSDYVMCNYPNVDVLFNPRLSGYGENHNINLKRTHGRYFVVMNSDMTVSRNVFERLFCFMEKNPDVGIVSPKVLNPDGSIQGLNKRYPTVWDLLLRRFMPYSLKKLFQRRLDYYEMRDVGYEKKCDVQCLSGAFMFCRTDVIKAVGGFDEKYFLYFEDFDLCRRVQKTHRTVYYPECEVVHYWARSAHMRFDYCIMFAKSAWRYFRKWGFAWC